MTRFPRVEFLLLGGLLTACGTTPIGPTPVDAGADVQVPIDTPIVTDTPPTDRQVTDTPATDAPRDVPRTDVPADAASGCAGLPIVNLNMAGMRAGVTTRYAGDNNAAYMTQVGTGMPTGRTPITPPSGSRTCITMTGQIVMSYTTGTDMVSLRISTTNMGTPRTFDTVLWVTNRCQTTLGNALCNDDDPDYATMADRRVSSLVTTEVLPPNTTLFIILGGFYPPGRGTIDHGAFDLTITEVVPVAMGGACRTDGTSMRCGTGLSCIPAAPFADTGMCQPTGSAAGGACRTSAPECDTGLSCNATSRVCVRTVAAGMPCDAYNQCDTTSNCVNLIAGAPSGTCTRAGTAAGADCRPMGAMGGRCDTGFTCSTDIDPSDATPTCQPVSTVGMPCVVGRVLCPTNSTCVTATGGTLLGTCRANGTVALADCRAAAPRCDAPLTCIAFNAAGDEHCSNAAMPGGACSPTADCPTNTNCLLNDLSDRYNGTCYAQGSEGGVCRDTAPNCDTGLTCSSATPANGLCQQVQMMAGGACHRLRRRCAEDVTCVLNMSSTLEGTCQANGSAAGTACRATDPICSTGFTCSGTFLSAGICQSAAMAGGACDPLNGRTVCPMGQVCQPTTYNTGICSATTTMEMEPNNSPMTAGTAVTAITNVRGALPRGDIDCVNVTVAMGGGILAEVSDGNGRCPPSGGNLVIDTYGPDGQLRGIAQSSGPGTCATVDGARAIYNYAGGLAAGTYTVCARGLQTATVTTASVPAYVFSVAPIAPRP